MSRYFSISFKSWSGRVLNLAIKFTFLIWGVIWYSWMRMFMYGGVLLFGTLLGTNAAGWFLYRSCSTQPSGSSAALETTTSCFNDFLGFDCFRLALVSLMIFAVMLLQWPHIGCKYHVSCKITCSHCQYKHNQNSKCLCLIQCYCSYHINASDR